MIDDIKLPGFQFNIDGMHLYVQFERFGYTGVAADVKEWKGGWWGAGWKSASGSYFRRSIDMRHFMTGMTVEQRKKEAEEAATQWREYRRGWENE